jgi:hypothetical protein
MKKANQPGSPSYFSDLDFSSGDGAADDDVELFQGGNIGDGESRGARGAFQRGEGAIGRVGALDVVEGIEVVGPVKD